MNIILPLAAIVTVVVTFLLLVKRHESRMTEYEINTRFDTPPNHPEMQAQAAAELVEQSFYGRGRPVSGTVTVSDDDGYEPNAYARWLEANGQKNGNDVKVVIRGHR